MGTQERARKDKALHYVVECAGTYFCMALHSTKDRMMDKKSEQIKPQTGIL